MTLESNESENEESANNFVQNLHPKLASDLGGLTVLRRALHLGVDAQGKRLTSLERAIYHKALDSYAKRINQEWNDPKNYQKLEDPEIQQKLTEPFDANQ